MPDKPRILIVRAGIGGLTLAAGLSRYRLTPTVVEIADESLSRGLALLLTSNTALALRRIGLDTMVVERAGSSISPALITRPSVCVSSALSWERRLLLY